MATKEIEARIDELVAQLWEHNRCSEGGVVDRRFFRAVTADVYEKAMLDAMVIVEGSPAQDAIETTTGYTLKGK